MTTRDELAERFYREQDWHSCNGISLGPYITRTFKAGYDAAAAERDGEISRLQELLTKRFACCAENMERSDRLRAALERIATGDGWYAKEAREALGAKEVGNE